MDFNFTMSTGSWIIGKALSELFPNDMSDWVGIGIPEEWTRKVLDFISANPDHIFLTLTKQPQNLLKFSPFPENCWVGVTATSEFDIFRYAIFLERIYARIKYFSIEPLLEWKGLDKLSEVLEDLPLDWLIIGSCTGTKAEMETLRSKYPDLSVMPFEWKWTAQPKIEWVQEIVEAADKAGIPVFLKENLNPMIAQHRAGEVFMFYDDQTAELRQEFPK